MNDLDLRIALARLDERVKALVSDIARTEQAGKEALRLAAEDTVRRLDRLSGENSETIRELANGVDELKTSGANLSGRLWLPMIIIAAVAAGLSAAAVTFFVGTR